MSVGQSNFKRKTELNLIWLLRGIIVACVLSGALITLMSLFAVYGEWGNCIVMACGVAFSWILIWYAEYNLHKILEYEGKVIWFVKFAREVLKPIKEREDAEKIHRR